MTCILPPFNGIKELLESSKVFWQIHNSIKYTALLLQVYWVCFICLGIYLAEIFIFLTFVVTIVLKVDIKSKAALGMKGLRGLGILPQLWLLKSQLTSAQIPIILIRTGNVITQLNTYGKNHKTFGMAWLLTPVWWYLPEYIDMHMRCSNPHCAPRQEKEYTLAPRTRAK